MNVARFAYSFCILMAHLGFSRFGLLGMSAINMHIHVFCGVIFKVLHNRVGHAWLW